MQIEYDKLQDITDRLYSITYWCGSEESEAIDEIVTELNDLTAVELIKSLLHSQGETGYKEEYEKAYIEYIEESRQAIAKEVK